VSGLAPMEGPRQPLVAAPDHPLHAISARDG
jgi:hypothetical protein